MVAPGRIPHSLNHDSGPGHRPKPALCDSIDAQPRSVSHGVAGVAERVWNRWRCR